MQITSWIQGAEGNKTDFMALYRTEQRDNMTAYFADAIAPFPLHPDFAMGMEIGSIDGLDRYVCDYRSGEYWCSPFFGTDLKDVPDESQYVLYQKKDGTFGLFLPVVSENYKCVFKGNPEGGLTARIFSWYDKLQTVEGLVFIHAEGENPFDLMKNCVRYALALLNTGVRTREERRFPEIFEYLGWCSWDAFQIRVTEKDLLQKCEEFRQKNFPVKWAILDDMWGHVTEFYDRPYADKGQMIAMMHASSLYDIEADPVRFPNGLKHCMDKMKEYGITPGIWHPTTGYWRGINPEGPLFQRLKPWLMQDEKGRWVADPSPEKSYMYYKTLHDFLRKCGAEFIKIDNQTMVHRFYNNKGSVGRLARDYHDAMESSVGSHFDNKMINCMGTGSEDVWNRQASPVSRCSDDFQPENKPWFVKHILQCAYASVLLGEFYWCDWDMWWTDDGQAGKNSVLSAVNGGPVYVSDTMDRSRREAVMPVVLSDGKILRCDRPAVPTADCLVQNFTNPTTIFKLQNMCNDSGVIAAFHLSPDNKALSGTVSPADINGLKGEEFVVYEHFSKEMHILKKQEKLPVTLKNLDDYKLFLIIPYENGFAPIGLIDKYISPKTIKARIGETVSLLESGTYAYVKDGKLYFENR